MSFFGDMPLTRWTSIQTDPKLTAFFFFFFFLPIIDLVQTVDEIYKVASISLSPNVPGQIFVSGICWINWMH